MKNSVKVAILMGSDSDLPVMKEAGEALEKLGISYEMQAISAHRTPHEVAAYSESARENGIRVFIAGAGGAAHLAGVIASMTELPVIAVPIANGPLQGQDALLAMVQMPRGVPVATVAIGGAWNAGILAAQILAAGGVTPDEALFAKLKDYKKEMREKVLAKRFLKKG